ncbi:unnamed protein product [Cochlearia groenlandica]
MNMELLERINELLFGKVKIMSDVPTFNLMLSSVAMRLKKHRKTLGTFGAWNRCLNHLLTLAESHIESVILAKFIDAVQKCTDQSARAALKLVCDLYAVDRIWNDIGTYRNVDYVAPNKAKVPYHVTRAPIAMQSHAYAHYTQVIGF